MLTIQVMAWNGKFGLIPAVVNLADSSASGVKN
jgi:hypothetical protein